MRTAKQAPPPPGYTQEEKIEIAHRHLVPKQLEQHGLTPQQIQIPQVTTLDIITRWVGSAGLRGVGVWQSGPPAGPQHVLPCLLVGPSSVLGRSS